MSERKFEVLFWGYSPRDGKSEFMVHQGKLFISLSSTDTRHTLSRVVADAFWGDF